MILNSDLFKRTSAYRSNVDELTGAFLKKVEDGTATPVDVVNHILTIDEGGAGCIPTSLGMGWIGHNPHAFIKVVGSPHQFFQACLRAYRAGLETDDPSHPARGLGCWLFTRIPAYRELVKVLELRTLEWWVSQVYPMVGCPHTNWVENLFRNQVSPDLLAIAIIDRLEKTQVRQGMANSIGDFLDGFSGHSSGQPDSALRAVGLQDQLMTQRHRFTHHPREAMELVHAQIKAGTLQETHHDSLRDIDELHMLSNQQLCLALMICAQKMPQKILRVMDFSTVLSRLNGREINTVIETAIGNLKSLSGLSLSTLRTFSLETRMHLAQNLLPVENYSPLVGVTVQFLCDVTCDLRPEEQADFFRTTVVPIIRDFGGVRIYRAWVALKRENRQLDEELQNKVLRDGYVFGVLQQGTIPSGRRRGQTQWYVDFDGMRHVWDTNMHRGAVPGQGMEVMFSRTGGRQLTPHVVLKTMSPVEIRTR